MIFDSAGELICCKIQITAVPYINFSNISKTDKHFLFLFAGIMIGHLSLLEN